MDMDDLIDQFTEDLDFDALKPWCDILDVDYEEPPLDDMYPAWEAELRTEIGEAMANVGKNTCPICGDLKWKSDLHRNCGK